ncbi:MAG: hypothetical protein ACRENE_15170 [Polyangiaceae bacterium]
MLRCGLSADGQGALPPVDGSSAQADSGMSEGGLVTSQDDGGSSSGSTTSSSSGAGTSSGAAKDDASDPLEGAAASLDGSSSGGHPLDGGPRDGAADSGSVCSHLSTCCTWLQQYGTSAMSVMSCQQTAVSGNQSSCAFLLGTFESAGLCLGA